MPHGILQQATKRSSELMETNNSVGSRFSDQLYSMLETGEGSTQIRDLLDQTLHNFAHTRNVSNPNYDWNSLRKFSSIKEKIAYITAGIYTHTNPTLTQNDIVNDTDLKNHLDEVIHFLECKLISNRDFTESWMLRHAAFNRFSAGLSPKESSSLNGIALELKKICEDNNFENLAQSTDFTKESDAQKIMKISQVSKELSANGVKIPDSIFAQIEGLDKKIEPLKKLDSSYKHMINMMNSIHHLPAGYPSMIGQDSQRKLISILEKLGKKEVDFLIKPRETNKNEEYKTIKEMYKEAFKFNLGFKGALEEFGVHENTFEQRFLVYFTYRNVEKAKSDLDDQKIKTFGERVKDYEQDHQQRRGRLRNRIFEVGSRMNLHNNTWAQRNARGGNRADFASEQDYELANSYFSKFQNLFFVNERDSYSDGRNSTRSGVVVQDHYMNMRNTIAAVLRRRMPALCTGNHDRHGNFSRKMYKWLEWFFKGQEEKGFWKMVKRTWNNADHAEIMAMMIMLNNQQQQKMLHAPRNPFEHKDGFMGNIFKGLHLTERYRQNLGKTIAPYANKFLKIVEVSGKTLIGKPLVAGAEKYNNALKKYRRYKTPFYALLPATWIIAKGKDAYHGTQKYLSEIKGEQVTQISSALVDATDALSSIVGKTASYAGGLSYDKYKTSQQKGVLSTFFELACEDDKRRELVQSSELSEIFNFQNRETYLFDEDGRTDMIEAKKEEIKEEAFEKEAKAIEEHLKKQLTNIDKQSNDKIIKYKDQLNSLYQNSTGDNSANIDRLESLIEVEDLINKDVDKVTSHISTIIGEVSKNKKDIGNLDLSISVNDLLNEVGSNNPASGLIKTHERSKKAADTQITIKESEILVTKNEIKKQQDIIDSIKTNKNWQKDIAMLTDYNTAMTDKTNKEKELIKKQQELDKAKQKRTTSILALSWLGKMKSFGEKVKKISDQIILAGNTADKKKLIKELSEYITSADILREKMTQQQITQQAASNLAGTLNAPPTTP